MIEIILANFNPRVIKGVFLGYSNSIAGAYRVYNKRTKVITESINIVLDDVVDSVVQVKEVNDKSIE